MKLQDPPPLTAAIRRHAVRLAGDEHDYDSVMARLGQARFVLLGEASHGTHEFYAERAALTRRLIAEHGFGAVAIEGDWPDAYRVNRYVRDQGRDPSGLEALAGFRRFPAWMWRNTDVLDFVEWLRGYNDQLQSGAVKAGFYGLDLYSLYSSLEAVIEYLDETDPPAAGRARAHFECFEQWSDEAESYGHATALGLTPSCEDAALELLEELRRSQASQFPLSPLDDDEAFYAEQNARVALDAERYYRQMFRGRASSWNLRDQHMMDTLQALADHLDRTTGQAKIIVWAHNSHLGDARATELSRVGELNLGQLVRERYPRDSLLVGFTTFTGTVTAASHWGEPPTEKVVRPALPGSYEALFHDAGLPSFLLDLTDEEAPAAADATVSRLRAPRLERAIGVIYLPQSERESHYFHARLADQFDVLIHIDETRAVEPLEQQGEAELPTAEPPETFPSAV